MTNRVTWEQGAYAGFWLRVGARLIDAVLVGTVTAVLFFLVGAVFAAGAGPGDTAAGEAAFLRFVAVGLFVLVLPDLLYDTLMTSMLGWTLGKRAVGIEVRRADGTLLSYPQALGRYLGRIVSTVPLYLGLLWAAWDARKQTWHDKFVNCYVLQSARVAPAGAPAAEHAARPWGGYSGWGIPAGQQRPAPGAPPGGGQEDAPARWDAPAESAAPPSGWGRPSEGGTAALSGPPSPSEGQAAGPAARDESGEHSRPALEGESLESARWATRPQAPVPERAPAAAPESTPEPEPPAEHEPEPPAELEPEPPAGPEPAAGPEPPAEEAPSPAGPWPGGPGEAAPGSGGGEEPAPRARASDPNVVGIGRAGINPESAAWLEQVADQVDSRLDLVAPQWRSAPHAEAARACAFGLLLGHLATIYPHMADDISAVAEAHPSFSTLVAGSRLGTLRQIVADPRRAAAWLGPLIGAEDPAQIQRLLD